MFQPKGQDQDNLTGGQIQQVWDTLIMSALSPILRVSRVFDLQLTYLITISARNRKRRVSSLDHKQLITLLCNALVAKTPEQQIELISQCKLERNILMEFVSNFLKSCAGYEEAYQEYLAGKTRLDRKRAELKVRAIERYLNVKPDCLYTAIHTSRDMLALAYDFRNTIINRFILHARKQSAKFIKSKQGTFDHNDMHQNILAAVTRAIDKYDSTKGALTSFVNFWILGAMVSPDPRHGHEYGTAYNIPSTIRRMIASGDGETVNFSHSLDFKNSDEERSYIESVEDPGDYSEDTHYDSLLRTCRILAKQVDHKLGLARLFMNIDEVYSKKELRLMKQVMIEQGTNEPLGE